MSDIKYVYKECVVVYGRKDEAGWRDGMFPFLPNCCKEVSSGMQSSAFGSKVVL